MGFQLDTHAKSPHEKRGSQRKWGFNKCYVSRIVSLVQTPDSSSPIKILVPILLPAICIPLSLEKIDFIKISGDA